MNKDWKIGDKILDRWEIHKILQGGMGIVYLIYDHQLKAAFAAKTFRNVPLSNSPIVVERFRRECLAWIGLDLHPNVVQAAFIELIEGRPFLFLEYVTGGDLSKWIGTPRLLKDLPQVLRFCIQFCDGMIHASSKGIKAHRDIKPANCLITENNTLKVTDFGLAKTFDLIPEVKAHEDSAGSHPGGVMGIVKKAFGSGTTSETQIPTEKDISRLSIFETHTGCIAGTFLYMAPEQFVDLKSVDIRADIYSFGIMLFEMATGRVPFAGKNFADLARMHKNSDLPSIPTPIPGINELLHLCLAKAPQDRISNFKEVKEKLVQILHDLTGETLPPVATAFEFNIIQNVDKANSLKYMGRYEQALGYYEKVLIAQPEMALSWACKAECLMALQWHAEAITCLERALVLDRDTSFRPSFLVGIADCRLALGRADLALLDYDRALHLDQSYWQGWTKKGLLLDQINRSEEALVCHERSIQINGKNPYAWQNKSACLGKLKRYSESLASADQALILDPDFAGAWFNKGASLVNGFQNFTEAIHCFDRAVKLGHFPAVAVLAQLKQHGKLSQNPGKNAVHLDGASPQAKPKPAQAVFDQGMALIKEQKHDEGLAKLEEAQRIGHPHAISVIAQIRLIKKVVALAHAGEPALATACLDEAVRLNAPIPPVTISNLRETIRQVPEGKLVVPQDKFGWNDMGVTLIDAGNLQKAMSCFMRAIDLDPGFETAWLNLGLVLGRLKEYQNALVCLDRLLANKPDSYNGWNLKGMTLGILHRQEEAIACYDRALNLNSKLTVAWYNKSLALNWQKRHEEGLECCHRVLDLEPRHFDALIQKAAFLIALGRKKDANECWEQMRLIDPNRAMALLNKTS